MVDSEFEGQITTIDSWHYHLKWWLLETYLIVLRLFPYL